jgi:chromate transporter
MSPPAAPNPAAASPPPPTAHLGDLALTFLRLGTITFGGPAAHVALMEDEFVRRRRWLTHAELLDMLAVANCIPGPSSTELAIFIGYRRAGLRGLLIAGTCFILPAALLVGILAWAYVRYGSLPVTGAILYGVKPVVIAVIVQAIWRLGRTAVKTWLLGAVALAAGAASFLGAPPLAVLVLSGLALLVARSATIRRNSPPLLPLLVPAPSLLAALTTTSAATAATTLPGAISLARIFLTFLKVGSLLFGSGYVLLAFLRTELVERLGFPEAKLLDAVAVGQITPGPVFTTATFIGYVMAGPLGALVATIGIFLPAFVLVALCGPFLPRLRQSPRMSAFLDGLNAASLALIAVVTWQLASAALVDIPTVVMAAVAAAILLFRPVNSAWLVLAGGVLGVVLPHH